MMLTTNRICHNRTELLKSGEKFKIQGTLERGPLAAGAHKFF